MNAPSLALDLDARPRPPALNLAWAALFLGAAVVLRMGLFGNLLYGDDEPFYSFVGGRMLHGARVYLDIWDRKPFGLFILFAGVRLLGDGVLVPQLLATLFAAGTAWMIFVLAVQRAPVWASAMAGLFYLVMAGALGGMIAQTPVFYNLLTALAAWLILRTAPALAGLGDLARVSLAMVLCGLSIQLKTDAALESAAFGLWLVTRLWRHRRHGVVVAYAAWFMALGLAPTLVVGVGFALAGEFGPWWYATFVSQLCKTGGFDPEAMWRLGDLALQSAPLLLAVGTGLWRTARDERWWLMALWSAAALVDGIAIGNFWTHYALPLALVASILSPSLWTVAGVGKWRIALTLSRSDGRSGVRVGLGGLLFLGIFTPFAASQSKRYWEGTASSRRVVARTLAVIPHDVRTRCMLAYETPVIYYDLTGACLATPYIFIDQLRSAAEAHALPEDASVALRKALARRPGTILTLDGSRWKLRNRANDAILADALARGYRRIAVVPQRRWDGDPESVMVWRRADLIRVR